MALMWKTLKLYFSKKTFLYTLLEILQYRKYYIIFYTAKKSVKTIIIVYKRFNLKKFRSFFFFF